MSTGLRYPTGFEANNYPIWSVLYHPEYQMFMNRNEVTLSIAGSFSGHLHRGAIKNMSLKASKSDDTITSTAPVKVEDMTLEDY